MGKLMTLDKANLTLNSTIHDILSTEHGNAVIRKYIPAIAEYPFNGNVDWTLNSVFREEDMEMVRQAVGLDGEKLERILTDLSLRYRRGPSEEAPLKSLDELDNNSFVSGPSPMASPAHSVSLTKGLLTQLQEPPTLSLDGEWVLAEGGADADRLSKVWKDSVPAWVPGSVHTALVQAGRIPDPTVGNNQKIARLESFKTWWMKRTFILPGDFQNARLIFGGICNRCTIWLNGYKLGCHEGMFCGPEFDVSAYLQAENTLIVKLDPIPFEPIVVKGDYGNYPENNQSWKNTVVFNNVYGWHYSNLPSLGIWRTVKIREVPKISITDLFLVTRDAWAGKVDLMARLVGKIDNWSGILRACIKPANFNAEAYHFEIEVVSEEKKRNLHLQFTIPDPHVWWPVDLGQPNLYLIQISFTAEDGSLQDVHELTFGLRTIEMAPFPDGPRPNQYNWTFIINGERHFVKGTGWCTMDPLLDFSRERYDRFLTLAALQHIQLLRAWGSGMPETDEFYDLCDHKGIMVLQEWPTAWNSHLTQPIQLLEETVRQNTLRLRNHPSLAMWTSGNESTLPFGEAIDMMGRLSIELDGTRPFHRGEPWGGSRHDYTCYWGRQHLDYNLTLTAGFFGEFGLACMPNYESLARYLPDDEKHLWPPKKNGVLVYHTPVFGYADDLSRLTQYASYFVQKDCSIEQFTVGSQLSQATGVRHTLERARARWPDCTGSLYYKLNDNFPAASWACVDWYGAPKIGYYFIQDAFTPLHVCILLPRLNFAGTPVKIPIILLDDSKELDKSDWRVTVRAYNNLLSEIRQVVFNGHDSFDEPLVVGSFGLTFEESDATPLLIVAEISKNGVIADRTFYWANFESVKGCLFTLPKTRLSWKIDSNDILVKNEGNLPAVAVNITRPGHMHTFTPSDNYFWLDPGEIRRIQTNLNQDIVINAWNSDCS
jgi:beta-mannosidase